MSSTTSCDVQRIHGYTPVRWEIVLTHWVGSSSPKKNCTFKWEKSSTGPRPEVKHVRESLRALNTNIFHGRSVTREASARQDDHRGPGCLVQHVLEIYGAFLRDFSHALETRIGAGSTSEAHRTATCKAQSIPSKEETMRCRRKQRRVLLLPLGGASAASHTLALS